MPTRVAHLDALESVLPGSAMSYATTLPVDELVGAMRGADIHAVIRACFRAGATETDDERIQALVNEGFSAIR